MKNFILSSTRILIGGKILFDAWNELFSEQKTTPLKNDDYQSFCDHIARTQGIYQQIIVGQDEGGTPSGIDAYSLGSLKTKNPQIILAKDRLADSSDIKFAIAHELGHLIENHGLIIQSILITNIALYAIPIIPIKYAFTTTIFSMICLVPIYRWMETRADNFAFTHCPEEVIRGAFKKDTQNPTRFSSYLFGGNIEKRKEATLIHSKNNNTP